MFSFFIVNISERNRSLSSCHPAPDQVRGDRAQLPPVFLLLRPPPLTDRLLRWSLWARGFEGVK